MLFKYFLKIYTEIEEYLLMLFLETYVEFVFQSGVAYYPLHWVAILAISDFPLKFFLLNVV